MKKCPFCAEEIQEAAVKCRYCGSMVGPWPAGAAPEAAEASPDAGLPGAPEPPMPRRPAPPTGRRTSAGALVVIVLLVGAIGLLVWTRGSESLGDLGTSGPSLATEAASIAPARVTTGDYQFLAIPWGAGRADVRARLEARGFSFIEKDADGDDQYQGRVDGRDAGVAAMFVGDRLAKFVVVMLAADPAGGLLEKFKQDLAAAYSTPARQQGLATLWPERGGTLVWVTTSEARNVTVHYEAAEWPAESRRRKGAR